jgi:hypothetical protein
MALQVKVEQKGLSLDILASKISGSIVPGFVGALADFAFRRMYADAPWRSGFLAMSISKQVDHEGATIEPTAKYAAFVEKGTGPHFIEPVSGSCLAFEAGEGNLVFTRLVHHPGTRANPFVERAAAETRDSAFKIFDEIWKREIR